MQVVFAPGCFDNFEGTQEELDALILDIQEQFANMSLEELEAQSELIGSIDLADEEWELFDATDSPTRTLQ